MCRVNVVVIFVEVIWYDWCRVSANRIMEWFVINWQNSLFSVCNQIVNRDVFLGPSARIMCTSSGMSMDKMLLSHSLLYCIVEVCCSIKLFSFLFNVVRWQLLCVLCWWKLLIYMISGSFGKYGGTEGLWYVCKMLNN